MSTFQHHTPSLGATLIGEENGGGLATFKGIPFADVKMRWTHSTVRDSLPSSPFDATKFGPRCPQQTGMVLVSGGSNDPVPGDHEFDCLNLNICAPRSALDASAAKLPVMVWIHGGGFVFGANSVGRYRMQAFCDNAAKNGTPIVLVQINYRLGVLGFGASTDLEVEHSSSSASSRSEHHPANYGMIDQRNALKWINAHIGDFGGDATNITVFGVSAGSASVHFHIVSGDPLFDRGIMMSGASSTLGPLPLDVYEREWMKLAEKCGVDNGSATPTTRLARMRDEQIESLIKKASTKALGPLGDGKFMPKTWIFDDHSSAPPSRCKEIILGDTNVEALILDAIPENTSQAEFSRLIDDAFPANSDADDFRDAFGFSKKEQPFEDYRTAMRLFLGAAMFQYPNIGIAKASLARPEKGKNVYFYHFEELSPYPGPTHNLSYHGLCALMTYLNELEACPDDVKKTSLETATLWAGFAHGKQPWEPYGVAKRFMRLGPHGQSRMVSYEEDDTRTYRHIEWMGKNFEAVRDFSRSVLFDR